MIRKIITPEKQTVSIDVPEAYIGKQLEVLIYSTEELGDQKETVKKVSPKLRGALGLTDDQYHDFQKFVNDARNEWNRAI